MAFKPQNILKRVQAGGFSIDNAVSQIQSQVPNLQQAANIDINGAINSVTSQAEGAINGAVQKLAGKVQLPGGLNLAGFTGFSNLFGGQGSALSDLGGQKPFPNQLEKFASSNYIFTLGCLTNYELNFPDITYRYQDPSVLVLKSGGGAGAAKTRTVYESQGAVEYFIDNVNIETIIAPTGGTKQTNATSIEFSVLEPYSMGMFLQTLNLAAKQAGHQNYIGAPFLLSIEFVGYDDDGNYLRPSKARRMFPLNFVDVTFGVTEGGSTYTVQAIPFHEQALADSVQTTKTDIKLQGSNISELLQFGPTSLASVLNDREARQEETGQLPKSDLYVFAFPNDLASVNDVLLGSVDNPQGATTKSSLSQAGEQVREFTEEEKEKAVKLQFGDNAFEERREEAEKALQNIGGFVLKHSEFGDKIRENAENPININEIGNSKIVKSYLDGGEVPFGRPAFVEVEDKPGVFSRGSLTISDDGRTFQFNQGTRIQDIIEEIIILSDYGRKLAENVDNPDSNGMIQWFKIETNVYMIDDPASINSKGTSPKVFVYQIVPYKIHVSKVANRNTATPGIENIKSEVCKEYNYIYTGANKDILDFQISINHAFFMALPADKGQLNADSKTKGQNNAVAGDNDQPTKQSEGANANSESGTSPTKDTAGPKNNSGGSGGETHTANQVARAYNDAIVNSDVDLIMVDMTIMGDPYYIADSGMGNYNAQQDPASINLTADGTIEYQRSEIDCILNFRTPIDTGDTWMQFPGLGTKPVGAFSGVYQVLFVSNKFEGGQFVQTLSLVRRPNQDTDTDAVPATSGNGAITDGDESNNVNENLNAGGPNDVANANKVQGGGTSQSNASGDPAEEGSTGTGSKPKPEENTVPNRIRGTL